MRIGHGIALGKIAHGGAQLAVRTAELRDDQFRQCGVGIFDLDGVLQFLVIRPHGNCLLPAGDPVGNFAMAKGRFPKSSGRR